MKKVKVMAKCTHCGKDTEEEYNLYDLEGDIWVCHECFRMHEHWRQHKESGGK